DETDIGRIEQQVHERMERVRRYQLLNPEPATEAMNRLAQALICLTDPQARQAYDAKLLADATPASEPLVAAAEPAGVASAAPPVLVAQPLPNAPAPANSTDPLAWLFGSWSPTPPPPPPESAPNQFNQLDWQNAPPPPVRLDVTLPPPPASLVDTSPTPV